MAEKGRRAAVGAIAVVAVAAVVIGVLHSAALSHLRDVEAVYVEGRQVTACATAALAPFAREEEGLDGLPEAVEKLVVEASSEVAELAADVDDLGAAPPYPHSRTAHDAVRQAIDAERALYVAMVDDPEHSEDELAALGRANTRAEDRLDAARRVLFVGSPKGWGSRNRCRQPSVSSSSK